ncbi:Uma2 family endonuclease [Actinomadura atramentaria]|uniref:Uma2 family endonuclease n=1 Tax=Actinomadura atramentaria TaxID=1990 RepID=UPI00036B0FE1|nr:Uma2 family endonuclease [Actinomadura atramentaria]
MTAMVHDQHVTQEQEEQEDLLLEGFLALQTPEGFRAEFIDGEIVVSPPPIGKHDRIVGKIVRQLYSGGVDLDFMPNRGLEVPRGGGCPSNHVIPDGAFAPTELDLFNDDLVWGPAEGVLLVLEVTSNRAERDRAAKRCCYARAGIDFYLLVDRDKQSVTLFHDPEGEDYRASVTEPFGKAVPLPEPFGFELDTAEFT